MMAHAGEIDPLVATGSYAGAMGAPQFMPSSFRRWAVDETGNGKRDLWKDWSDVFASVANYFIENGWRTGEPVMAESSGYNTADDPLATTVALKDTVGSLKARGYRFDTKLPADAATVLVPAELPDAMSWRVGFNNWYVITRYNRSPLYAMAVHDLATTLRARFEEVPPAPGLTRRRVGRLAMTRIAGRLALAASLLILAACGSAPLAQRAAHAGGVRAAGRSRRPAGRARVAAVVRRPPPHGGRARGDPGRRAARGSRAACAAIRRSTPCSASAIRCCRRARAFASAVSRRGTAPPSTRRTPRSARPTTCTRCRRHTRHCRCPRTHA